MAKRAKGEGTLRRRKDGTYEGRVILGYNPLTGKPINKSVYAKTKAIVIEKMKAAKAEALLPQETTHGMTGRTMLKDWMLHWLKTYNTNIKPATYSEYSQEIRLRINPYIGEITLNKLTLDAIQTALNFQYENQKASAKTISNAYGVLHKALDRAVQIGLILTNPSNGFVKPRVPNSAMRMKDAIMTTDEMASFLRAMDGCEYGDFFKFLLYTGIRKGEGIGLFWKNIDLNAHEMRIDHQLCYDKEAHEFRFQEVKNSRPRTIALNSYAMQILERRKQLSGDCNPESLVFTTARGTHLHPTTLHKAFKKVLVMIGKENIRIHDLRHNFATMTLAAGVDIKTLQDTLGHATEAFTLRQYSHANMEMHHTATNKMDAFLDGIIMDSAREQNAID